MYKLCLEKTNEADHGVSRETKLSSSQLKEEKGRMQTLLRSFLTQDP